MVLLSILLQVTKFSNFLLYSLMVKFIIEVLMQMDGMEMLAITENGHAFLIPCLSEQYMFSFLVRVLHQIFLEVRGATFHLHTLDDSLELKVEAQQVLVILRRMQHPTSMRGLAE